MSDIESSKLNNNKSLNENLQDYLTNSNDNKSPKCKHKCSIICPSLEYLNQTEIVTNVVCSVKGCDEIFSQQSALNLHLEKVHKIINKNEKSEILMTRAMSKSQKISEKCNCRYHCPIEECKYNLNGKKVLPTFHSLKNHFIRIHGIKKFKCSKCNKYFSIKSEMERHEANCGQLYKCTECDIGYSTLSSLNKHLKKKHYQSFSDSKIESKKFKSTNVIPTTTSILNFDSLPTRPAQIILLKSDKTTENSIILFPLQSSTLNLSTSTDSANNLIKENFDNSNQRSFASQTTKDLSATTQETGCQTVITQKKNFIKQTNPSDSFNHLNNHFNPSLELCNESENFSYQPISTITTQQTQTPTQDLCVQSENLDINVQNTNVDLDAATSTFEIDLLFNNISTQTQQIFFTNSSMQTQEILNENDEPYYCHELSNIDEYFNNNKESNNKESQTHYRCITPSNTAVCSYASSSQTDDLCLFSNYNQIQQYPNSNTISIQTQTYYTENDLINNYNAGTQTEWKFSS